MDVIQGEPLQHQSRWGVPVRRIIVHESVTTSRASTIAVLRKRGLGVHFSIDADGSVEQHVPLDKRTAHCSGWNASSIGIEIVNPYYRCAGPWIDRIKAPWADGGHYVLPTIHQTAALTELILHCRAECPRIPDDFPAVSGGQYTIGLLPKSHRKRPGILSHHHVGTHADASFPVLVAWLQIRKGIGAQVAFDRAVDLLTGAKGTVSL